MTELQDQVDRLATFIIEHLPHEPSEGEDAIDCAIRLLSGGAGLIADERSRQINREGYTPEHDDGDVFDRTGDLTQAAIAYAINAWSRITPTCGWDESTREHATLEQWWPWDAREFKPVTDDPKRTLVKAGALIAAELDRLARAETS